MTDDRLERYAELAVQVGANVAPGQVLDLDAALEHAPLVRALTRAGTARARAGCTSSGPTRM